MNEGIESPTLKVEKLVLELDSCILDLHIDTHMLPLNYIMLTVDENVPMEMEMFDHPASGVYQSIHQQPARNKKLLVTRSYYKGWRPSLVGWRPSLLVTRSHSTYLELCSLASCSSRSVSSALATAVYPPARVVELGLGESPSDPAANTSAAHPPRIHAVHWSFQSS